MEPIDRMEEDHALFRSKLQVMTFAVDSGADGWFILREVGFELWKRLADHVGRENQLIRTLRREHRLSGPDAGSGAAAEGSIPDHHDELADLQALNGLLGNESSEALVRLRPLFLVFMARLRRRMDEQESVLFPKLTERLNGLEADWNDTREIRDLDVWEPHGVLVRRARPARP